MFSSSKLIDNLFAEKEIEFIKSAIRFQIISDLMVREIDKIEIQEYSHFGKLIKLPYSLISEITMIYYKFKEYGEIKNKSTYIKYALESHLEYFAAIARIV